MADTIPDVTKAVAEAAISETATAEVTTVAPDELAPLQSPSGQSRASAVAQPQPRYSISTAEIKAKTKVILH
ncbi:hypothetical protein HDU81_004320, partial [Chytriomyces hyalinus]